MTTPPSFKENCDACNVDDQGRNDQYLCIVASRGTANEGLNSKVFLPFEGDSTLAIILSKALLLADDKSIKDETILRQIFP